MGLTGVPMNELIEQIYASGCVRDAEDKTLPLGQSAVTFDTGAVLYELVRATRPKRTLEIGLAYGLSALFICQALRDNGEGHHDAIDPHQKKGYQSVGLLNIERACLQDLFAFHHAPSHQVLPALCEQAQQYDFAFVDGSHLFDYTLVDFFYIDRLLGIGGHMVFDDLWMPSVRKVVSFALTNKPYVLVRNRWPRRTRATRWLMRFLRRVVQNPVARDWKLKMLPENTAVIEKIGADERRWDFHKAF